MEHFIVHSTARHSAVTGRRHDSGPSQGAGVGQLDGPSKVMYSRTAYITLRAAVVRVLRGSKKNLDQVCKECSRLPFQ
jgi:hypothetical protein